MADYRLRVSGINFADLRMPRHPHSMHNCETAVIPDRVPPTQFIDSLEDYEPGWSTLPGLHANANSSCALSETVDDCKPGGSCVMSTSPAGIKKTMLAVVSYSSALPGGWKCVPRSSRPYRAMRWSPAPTCGVDRAFDHAKMRPKSAGKPALLEDQVTQFKQDSLQMSFK